MLFEPKTLKERSSRSFTRGVHDSARPLFWRRSKCSSRCAVAGWLVSSVRHGNDLHRAGITVGESVRRIVQRSRTRRAAQHRRVRHAARSASRHRGVARRVQHVPATRIAGLGDESPLSGPLLMRVVPGVRWSSVEHTGCGKDDEVKSYPGKDGSYHTIFSSKGDPGVRSREDPNPVPPYPVDKLLGYSSSAPRPSIAKLEARL